MTIDDTVSENDSPFEDNPLKEIDFSELAGIPNSFRSQDETRSTILELVDSDPKKARELLDSTYGEESNDEEFLYIRGMTYLRQNDFQSAIDHFAKIDPTDEQVPLLYRLDTIYAHAEAYRKLELYEDEIQTLSVGINMSEGHKLEQEVKELLYNLFARRSKAYEMLKNFDNAQADISKALELEPTNISLIHHRGMLRCLNEDWNESQRDLEIAKSLGESSANSNQILGYIYARQGENGKALEAYTDAILQDPKGLTLAYVERARIRVSQGDFEGVAQDLQQAIQNGHNCKESREIYAMSLVEIGQEDAAIIEFNDLVHDFPNDDTLYALRAATYSKMHKFDLVINDLTTSIEMKPTAGRYEARASAKYHINDLLGAIQDYKAAYKLEPRDETLERIKNIQSMDTDLL